MIFYHCDLLIKSIIYILNNLLSNKLQQTPNNTVFGLVNEKFLSHLLFEVKSYQFHCTPLQEELSHLSPVHTADS